MFTLNNIQDGEEVYQRCVLISGKCLSDVKPDDHVVVETKNEAGELVFPDQRWPMYQGVFKALVMLTPGPNTIIFKSDGIESTEVL
jgi:hypothetical protein